MAYNNNYQQNQYMSGYYNDQGGPSANYSPTSPTFPARVQELNQTYASMGNNSTKSLGGATAVETPRVNPIENADEVDPINSYSQQGAYNRQDQEATINNAYKQSYSQPRYSIDKELPPILTKRDSTTALNSTQPPLNAYDLGDQHYSDYNRGSGYFSKYNKYNNKYRRQDDPYYDEEATRHNTLTSGDPNAYGFENDYTDRDFPGGGKGARQSMTGEKLSMPVKKRKRCCCCTLPTCLLITVVILIGLGILGFFVAPRQPKVNVENAIPVSTPIITSNPPFISMDFSMVVVIDNNENYVPYKFNRVDVSVFDRIADSKPIATGTKLDYTLQPKLVDTVDFPLTVNYTGTSQKDPVIQNFINACSPQVKRHAPLRLRVEVELSIWGIDWAFKPKISVPIPDMKCPDIGV